MGVYGNIYFLWPWLLRELSFKVAPLWVHWKLYLWDFRVIPQCSVPHEGNNVGISWLCPYLCIQHAIVNISCFCNSSSVILHRLLNSYGPQSLLTDPVFKLCENKHLAMYSNVLALWKYILPHNSWIWGQGQEIGKNLKTTQELSRQGRRKQLLTGEVGNSTPLLQKNNVAPTD